MRVLITTILFAGILTLAQASAAATPTNAEGKIEFLRVHDLGTGYGGANDFLDAEVIIKLSTSNYRFGFQLRQDKYLPARQAMLDLLMTAFRNNWSVRIDYMREEGKNHHRMYLVWLTRDEP
jgi:hypothetical protein